MIVALSRISLVRDEVNLLFIPILFPHFLDVLRNLAAFSHVTSAPRFTFSNDLLGVLHPTPIPLELGVGGGIRP